MHLDHIELSQLVISRANMRAKHRRDIADLIPSVRSRGVLVPLLVRRSGEPDRYEIVAGRRRFLAASAIAGDGKALVPCAIMEPGDDAAALEASLIENIARVDADEVTQWETFARLIKEGRSTDDIASTFGLSERVVGRILALGNLLPRIRALYRDQQIDTATVRHLTMATAAQQREWLALLDSPDAYAPTGRALKDWLFGGSAIRTSLAMFDLATYTAPITADLFDEHSYFSDIALFWTLQSEAIAAKRDAYLADGWREVVVLAPGARFDRWEYEKRPKSKGGRVYVTATEQGAVEVFEGFLPRKEAERLDNATKPAPARARSELTAPLHRYIDLHRHAAVRMAMLEEPRVAMRAMLAHVIVGSGLWSVRRERQRADKPETEQSVVNSKAQTAFNEKRIEMLGRLGLDADRDSIVGGHCGEPVVAMMEQLNSLSDEELLALIPIVMGETLEAGTEVVDALGLLVTPNMADLWSADDAFLSLVRDRTVLTAMLEEVAGPHVAEGNAEAKAKVLKAILADYLEGRNGRTKVDGWVPAWLRFPARSYIDSGVPTLDASIDI